MESGHEIVIIKLDKNMKWKDLAAAIDQVRKLLYCYIILLHVYTFTKIHFLSSSGLVFIGMLRRLVSAYSKAIFRSTGSY